MNPNRTLPLLIAMLIMIGIQGVSAQRDSIPEPQIDSMFLKIGDYRYYSLGFEKRSTYYKKKEQLCFYLIRPEDKTNLRDSLDIQLLNLEKKLNLNYYKFKELDSLKNIEIGILTAGAIQDSIPETKNESELDLFDYDRMIGSLEIVIKEDSLEFKKTKLAFDSISKIVLIENSLDTLYCFNEIKREEQNPIKYPDYKGLNIKYIIDFANLNAGKVKAFRNRWTKKNKTSLLLSQNAFKNWNSGGNNSISTIIRGQFERDYFFEFIRWENDLKFGIGFNQEKNEPIRKTEDMVEFDSIFGYRTNLKSNWYYSSSLQFRTQFANGYNYPNTEAPISKFMAPAYFLLGVGASYSSTNKKIKYYISPLTNKTTFVLDQTLANSGSFGVQEATYDADGNILTLGKRNRTEIGILLQGSNEMTLFKNVKMKNELRLYSDYINNFGNIDVDWSCNIDFLVNKNMKANFGMRWIYDDDIDTFTTDSEGNEINEGPKLQIKQLLGLGLTYSF